MKSLVASACMSLIALTNCAASAEELKLFSTDIEEGKQLASEQVFEGFGCSGGNLAPSISWSGAPKNTKSFAITVYDPDAPTGSGWWHWFAFNIPADVSSLKSGNELPKNVIELSNDYGSKGFGGACPPVGEVHRYQFTIHALDTMLEIDGTVSNALAGYMVNANSIASSTITAVYTR